MNYLVPSCSKGALWTCFLCLTAAAGEPADNLQIRRIWDQGRYNAFTDLVQFKQAYYCAFREGEAHVFGADGCLRILRSEDGETWNSAALLTLEGVDLRDPKLSVTPDDRLMVLAGGSHYDGKKLIKRICQVSFSADGAAFTPPAPIRIDPAIAGPQDWLWRVTWHEGKGYGVVYQAVDGGDWKTHLVETRDGIEYQLIHSFDVTGKPNEAALRFKADGTMLALLRREGGNQHGMIGRAPPPYREWTWRELPAKLGGPNLCCLPDGSWIAGTRAYGEKTTTVLASVSPDGDWRELLTLPSGGDTSYPGLLVKGDQLWMSYYSSHEGKASIYLAKIPLTRLVKPEVEILAMSFNIRYGTAKDGDNRWENRRAAVIELIRAQSPDVLGLQEALRFQLDALREGLEGYVEIGEGREGGTAGEYSAILVRSNRFDVSESGTFWLSDTPEKPSKHWGNNCIRVCTWARLVDRPTGRGFNFYNTHLDHESQPAREKGARLILDRINARSRPEPFLLSGDFNAGEDSPAIRLLREKSDGADAPMIDPFRALHPEEKNVGTFNGFKPEYNPRNKIDYIFASPGARTIEAAILRDAKDGRFPSDHFPVTVRIAF